MSSGCAEPEIGEGEGDQTLRSSQVNGFGLNGFGLNGFGLNGFGLNGVVFGLDGEFEGSIELTKVNLPGAGKVDYAVVESGQLQIVSKGKVYSGDEVVGAKLTFDVTEAEHGNRRKMVRITGVDVDPESGVYSYESLLKVEKGGWEPLCVDDEGNAVNSILLGEIWDPATGDRTQAGEGAVTFACQGAALAKCANWGYLPWADVEGVSLQDVHQACTRMVRADYCGDGIAHTVNGTLIHVLDELGVQSVDDGLDYGIEAEWGPDGATCLNIDNTRIEGVDVGCSLPACGASFASGGALQSGKVFGEL